MVVDRSKPAPSRSSRRSTARRLAAGSKWRSAAIIASPSVGEARHAGSEARPSAGGRRDAAPSACGGGEKAWKCARPATRSVRRRLRLRACRPPDRRRADPPRGRLCRGGARCPAATEEPERQDKMDECRSRHLRHSSRRMPRQFRGFDAPLKNVEGGQVRDCEKPYSRRRHRRAQAVHGADERQHQRRNNISSSPSARPPRSKACPSRAARETRSA